MFKHILLYFALLLWFVVPSQAQLTIFGSDLTVVAGSTFNVEFKVVDFNLVAGMQYSMVWDKTVLEFQGVQQLDLGDATIGGNIGLITPDTITFAWADFSLVGYTLADSSVLITLGFKAIGPEGSSSVVAFSSKPTAIEVAHADTGAVNAILIDGNVLIDSQNSVKETENPSFKLYQNHPNPFNKDTQIKFKLTESEIVTFSVTDISGKEVYQQTQWYNRGSHVLTLDSKQLKGTGIYFYRLANSKLVMTKKMLLVE